MLDGRGDEGGLRRRRATVVERHSPDGKKVFQWVVGDNLVFATGLDRKVMHAVALYEGNPNYTLGGSPRAYAGYVAAEETSCHDALSGVRRDQPALSDQVKRVRFSGGARPPGRRPLRTSSVG